MADSTHIDACWYDKPPADDMSQVDIKGTAAKLAPLLAHRGPPRFRLDHVGILKDVLTTVVREFQVANMTQHNPPVHADDVTALRGLWQMMQSRDFNEEALERDVAFRTQRMTPPFQSRFCARLCSLTVDTMVTYIDNADMRRLGTRFLNATAGALEKQTENAHRLVGALLGVVVSEPRKEWSTIFVHILVIIEQAPVACAALIPTLLDRFRRAERVFAYDINLTCTLSRLPVLPLYHDAFFDHVLDTCDRPHENPSLARYFWQLVRPCEGERETTTLTPPELMLSTDALCDAPTDLSALARRRHALRCHPRGLVTLIGLNYFSDHHANDWARATLVVLFDDVASTDVSHVTQLQR